MASSQNDNYTEENKLAGPSPEPVGETRKLLFDGLKDLVGYDHRSVRTRVTQEEAD